MNLHVLYTRTAVLLARSAAGTPPDGLPPVPELLTTLGPWSVAEVVDYLRDEHPDLAPDAAIQVAAFLASGATRQVLSFRPRG